MIYDTLTWAVLFYLCLLLSTHAAKKSAGIHELMIESQLRSHQISGNARCPSHLSDSIRKRSGKAIVLFPSCLQTSSRRVLLPMYVSWISASTSFVVGVFGTLALNALLCTGETVNFLTWSTLWHSGFTFKIYFRPTGQQGIANTLRPTHTDLNCPFFDLSVFECVL